MSKQLNDNSAASKLQEVTSQAEKYLKLKRDYKTTKWKASSEPVKYI
jgi:hypothetical protein